MTAQAAAKTPARVGRGDVPPWDNLALIDAYADGFTFDEIAADTGRSRNAVKLQLSALRRRGDLAAIDSFEAIENDDAGHVAACLAAGGFPTFTDKRANPDWRRGSADERARIDDATHTAAVIQAGGFPVGHHPRTGQPLVTYPTRAAA